MDFTPELIKIVEDWASKLPDTTVYQRGGKSYTPSQIVEEIRRKTELGERLYNRFIERVQKR